MRAMSGEIILSTPTWIHSRGLDDAE